MTPTSAVEVGLTMTDVLQVSASYLDAGWRVGSMGWTPTDGYWIVFQREEN